MKYYWEIKREDPMKSYGVKFCTAARLEQAMCSTFAKTQENAHSPVRAQTSGRGKGQKRTRWHGETTQKAEGGRAWEIQAKKCGRSERRMGQFVDRSFGFPDLLVSPLFASLATTSMGWLRIVGSFKLKVSFAKKPCKKDYILQKRPIILGAY